MIRRRNILFVVTALAIAGTGTTKTWAAPDAESAGAFISDLINKVLKLRKIDKEKGGVSSDHFRSLFTENFGLEYISRFVLGRYWNTATAGEQREFISLFTEYVTALYSNRFDHYRGDEFQIGRPRVEGALDVIVPMTIIEPNSAPIMVEWRVRQTDNRPKIIDVAIENVSMGRTQRTEVESIIQRSGGKISSILDDLRSKAQAAKKEAAAKN